MSTDVMQETTTATPPRRKKGKLRRFLRFFFYTVLVLLGSLAAYAWFTGARQDAIETGEPSMKAVVYTDYGSPDVLQIRDIKKPTPNDDQVLIKVRAVSVNPYDWHFVRGEPYIMRLGNGLRKPKNPRVGVDFSGVVEAVGKNITQFKIGAEVYGGRTGAFAQYIVMTEKNLILKPDNVSFEQAAAVQIAAMTALQGLRDKGRLQAGEKVLINGASGGVGSYAVQIAKTLGADVTAVCSTRNVDLVRSIGADHVIDYTKEDYTRGAQRYDLILDMVGNHGLLANSHALKPEGRYVMIGGPKGKWLAPLDTVIRAMLLKPFVKQEMGFMMSSINRDDLMHLRELMQSGKVTPVIDRTYNGLAELPAALAYLEEGRARGKVVVKLE